MTFYTFFIFSLDTFQTGESFDFFYWRKELGWVDLSDTMNMFIKPAENLLEVFEKIWDFEKMKLKMRLEYSDKTSFFGLKLFFRDF